MNGQVTTFNNKTIRTTKWEREKEVTKLARNFAEDATADWGPAHHRR
jgi:hypothetical protein